MTNKRAEVLADDVRAFLYREHPHAAPVEVCAALMVIVGDIIARDAETMTTPEIVDTVKEVATVLGVQIGDHLRARGKLL